MGLGFFKKSKANLEIEKPILLKKSIDQIEGYQLKVGVKNKGKGACLNLSAKFEIKDSHEAPPELLSVRVNVTNGKKEITATEEAIRAVDYAWIDPKERIFKVLNELKSNDSFSLLYPYETFFAGVGSSTSSSEYLLNLKTNTNYVVEIEVKGKDRENNAVIGKKKCRLQT